MEAELKIQAVTAMGMLCIVSLASSPFDYIDSALRTIQDTYSAMTPQEQPRAAAELLTSTHTLALAPREVAELEMSVGAAILVLSRWLEPKADGLQGLPAAAWRVCADELAEAMAHAGEMMEATAMHCYHASAVVDVATNSWFDFALGTREAWIQDAKSSLASARDRLIDARCSLVKTRAAAIRARDSAKIMIDLL